MPGLLDPAPACGLAGGDDGPFPNGAGCSAADLCATGWHLCASAADVAGSSPTGCDGAVTGGGLLFFATGQSGPGCGLCATGDIVSMDCQSCICTEGCLQTKDTANDLFGCGTLGDVPGSCGVLDRFSNNGCADLTAPWSCNGNGCDEALVVTKPGLAAGGVLCCRD